MKRVSTTLTGLALALCVGGQNVGIGISDPTRAKLEVFGVAGLGKTTAIFGDSRAISLHTDYPGIGMNQFLDNSQYGRYLANGFAAAWKFVHDDATLAQGLSLQMYPSGTANFAINQAQTVWNMSINGRLRIRDNTIGGVNGHLNVGRGDAPNGTAMFMGTTNHSIFNYSTAENTYIRGGKGGARVYLNDIANGNVVFGNGNTTVGINTDYYVPPTTLEIRQSNGGIEIMNSFYTDRPWEWRVASGSPANFQLYYQNGYKNQFLYTTGALSVASDRRLKQGIRPLESVMDKILQLKPVSYRMTFNEAPANKSIGFLAQEVLPLFPEFVSHQMGDDQQYLGLDYSGFSVIALKGMQEQQVALQALDEKLARLEERLKLLNAKNSNSHGKK